MREIIHRRHVSLHQRRAFQMCTPLSDEAGHPQGVPLRGRRLGWGRGGYKPSTMTALPCRTATAAIGRSGTAPGSPDHILDGPVVPLAPFEAAKAAGLRYVTDELPGI